MRKTRFFWAWALVGVLFIVLGPASTALAEKPVVIGYHIDYERLTTIGPQVGAGMHDFIKVFNKRGGTVEGVKVEFSECDHGYNVDRGLECYQRQKMEGMVSLSTFGTPHTYALTPKLTADKIPAISPGFGGPTLKTARAFLISFRPQPPTGPRPPPQLNTSRKQRENRSKD
jgi:branched-chain amino acid transport system substrate-binding protein